MIHVVVYSEANPGTTAAGARVVFAAPDQSVQTVFTDANGIAEARSAPGTTVTVIQTEPSATIFSSFLEIQPGATLIAGPRTGLSQAGDVQITVDMPPVAGGRFYTIAPSCPYDEVADQSIVTRVELSARVPCSNALAATLVGRAYDSTHQTLLGVSLLQNADLTTASTIVMPAFNSQSTAIVATIDNLPSDVYGLGWSTYYLSGTEYTSILEQAGVSTMGQGTTQLMTTAFPVGDATTSVLDILRNNGGFSEFHLHRPTTATSFSFDAQQMIRSVARPVEATTTKIDWVESPIGVAPTTVTIGVEWGDTRGIIYAPYNGPSLSLGILPQDVAPPSTDMPSVVALQYFSTGRSYAEDLADLNEIIGISDVTMASANDYWRSSGPFGGEIQL